MNGCQFSCPMCRRKCDLDSEAHDKHECKNGHYLRGMNGVLVEDKPSLYTCEEIADEAEITTLETKIVKTWKQVRNMYPEWQFQSMNDLQQHKQKMMKVWNNGVGQLLCNWLSMQLKIPVAFTIKHDLEKLYQTTEHLHYIMMLDDSYSMQGNNWTNIKNGAVSCMADIEQYPNAKISIIIFNSDARVVLDCQKTDVKTQHEKISFRGGLTNFSQAFKRAYEQIEKYQNMNFKKIIILFYTDGVAEYPDLEIQKICNLSAVIKKKITLIACTESKWAPILSQIVQSLMKQIYRADLKTSIQTSAVRSLWSEIVSQNYHKLRC